MGLSYLKSIHGILSFLQTALLAFTICAAFLMWSDEQVYFLFFKSGAPLMSVVLVVFVLTWLASAFILINQLIGNDVLEGLGKMKVLPLHAICGLLLVAATVITSIYYFQLDDNGYTQRLLYVMIAGSICAVTYAIQFVRIFLDS